MAAAAEVDERLPASRDKRNKISGQQEKILHKMGCRRYYIKFVLFYDKKITKNLESFANNTWNTECPMVERKRQIKIVG